MLSNRLLKLMPNVTSLEISPGEDSYDAPYIVPRMLRTEQKLTSIRFDFYILDEQAYDLVSAYSESLQELRLCSDDLTSRAYRAIGEFRRE